MNSEWSEKIFDSLMEEVVEGKRPPDLTARIAAAWRAECEDPARAESLALQSSIENAMLAKAAEPSPNATTIESIVPASVSPVRSYRKNKKSNRGWYSLAAVAAGLVLTAGGLQWYQSTLPSQPIAKVNNAQPKVAEVTKPSQPESTGEQLSLDKVPFSGGPSAEDIARRDKPKSEEAKSSLGTREIVELIDSQLASLWQSKGISPSSPMNHLELGQALSKTLTGEDLPNNIASTISSLDISQAREEVLNEALSAQLFNRKFADQFVNLWFQGGKLDLADAQVAEVRNYVAGTISTKPWNEVLRKVLGSDALIAAHAGDGNHGFASRISEAFMDRSIGCARCHANSQSDDVAISQDQYWSFVGLLSGLDSQATPEGRKAVDKQAEAFASNKGLFFERPDKTLEAVKYLLPNNQPWQSIANAKSPRSALFDWITQSEAVDRATVNQVWQIAMGRPLVPTNAVTDDFGSKERVELNHFLAQQFRLHGRDIRQLVGWVVRSDAFARSGIKLDRDRWLQATDTDLAQWHAAEQTFAARTSLGQGQQKSLDTAIASVVKWNAAKIDTRVLAQPQVNLVKPNAAQANPAATKPSPAPEVKNEVAMPAASYVIHHGRLTEAQSQYLDKLLASEKLTWDQKVDHVLSLSPRLKSGPQTKAQIEELTKTIADKKAILSELLWIVQNANAG